VNVCYLGPHRDYSGYGEANRHAIAALDAAGVNVVARLVRYSIESSDFGTLGVVTSRLLENQADYKIRILHVTPDQYRKHMEPGKYHIGHFFWETDRVPEAFMRGINLMDEIWTGSEANADAMRRSGLKDSVDVFICPQAIETDREFPAGYEIPGFPDNGFMFYSIFEWIDRKNPEALLNAYWKEFQANEPVGLLIKTYFKNFALQNKNHIRREIELFKRRANLPAYPPVYLYLDLMDRRHVSRIHKTGDCFVSAHRGEGWGVPQVEAALAGRPVISTGYGGCHEYFQDAQSAMLVNYTMEPVNGMAHSSQWYGSDQKWAEINGDQLQAAMRVMYNRGHYYDKIASAGQDLVLKQFNLKTVGQLMAKRLAEIEGGL
jgi:glycosyltransferase involved in cell wall biosynthesis